MRQGVLILAAGRVRSMKIKKIGGKKKHEKIPPHPRRTTKSTALPVIVTTSRRRAAKHVPRVNPHLPASIDPGFVEIGLVQLSQSVKTTNVTHAH